VEEHSRHLGMKALEQSSSGASPLGGLVLMNGTSWLARLSFLDFINFAWGEVA